MVVQPVPQQGLLGQLTGGRGQGTGSRRAALGSPRMTPSPAGPHSLDVPHLLLGLPGLLLQDLPLRLARAAALFLLQILKPEEQEEATRLPTVLLCPTGARGGLWG